MGQEIVSRRGDAARPEPIGPTGIVEGIGGEITERGSSSTEPGTNCPPAPEHHRRGRCGGASGGASSSGSGEAIAFGRW